jgi:hypothetical protein
MKITQNQKYQIMKKRSLFLFTFAIIVHVGFGQKNFCIINFEDWSLCWKDTLVIDTVNYPNNNWEIGQPNKAVFQNAHSEPNAIVTKLNTYYSSNDTSVFTIIYKADMGLDWYGRVTISADYRIDSDTLTDYGTIEYSPDNGLTWIDLLTDTFYYQLGLYQWNGPKPVFSGSSSGWQKFYLQITDHTNLFNISYGDTVLFRFTFISDSIQTFRDGWMIDNISIEDIVEGIEEFHAKPINISIYPNPVSSVAVIESDTPLHKAALIVYNAQGQKVKQLSDIDGQRITVECGHLPNGLYFVQLIEQNKPVATAKLIIGR